MRSSLAAPIRWREHAADLRGADRRAARVAFVGEKFGLTLGWKPFAGTDIARCRGCCRRACPAGDRPPLPAHRGRRRASRPGRRPPDRQARHHRPRRGVRRHERRDVTRSSLRAFIGQQSTARWASWRRWRSTGCGSRIGYRQSSRSIRSGTQVAAQAVAVALDPVDLEPEVLAHAATILDPVTEQRPVRAWWTNSSPKTLSALTISCTAPSGWWQAPRPSTSDVQRSMSADLRGRRRDRPRRAASRRRSPGARGRTGRTGRRSRPPGTP